MPFPTFIYQLHTIASAGDIYFQLVLKILLFEVYQYVIDRFENPTTRVVVRIGFAYPILKCGE